MQGQTSSMRNGRRIFASALCLRIEEQLDIVKMLVEAGAGVRGHRRTRRQARVLPLRRIHGHTETVRYLVGLPEVELNLRDGKQNKTALHLCGAH